MTAGNLSLSRAQIMNQHTVGTFFNMLEKVATENNLSDAPGNVINNNESGIQINNKPDSVRGLKVFMF
jgi:hypothetical protein